MTRFASAPWPLKAAYVGAVATAGATLVLGVAAVIALVGLRRFSADIDPAAVPGWFWYFRADPEVRRWLGVGVLSSGGLAAIIALGLLRGLVQPLAHPDQLHA